AFQYFLHAALAGGDYHRSRTAAFEPYRLPLHGQTASTSLNPTTFAASYELEQSADYGADPGRYRHRKRAPKKNANCGLPHVGTARFGANNAEQGETKQGRDRDRPNDHVVGSCNGYQQRK